MAGSGHDESLTLDDSFSQNQGNAMIHIQNRSVSQLVMTLLLITLVIAGCHSSNPDPQGTARLSDQSTLSVLWYQTSAEARALCYQTYNLARLRLQSIVAEHPDPTSLAVVLDVDETVLDNAPYQARRIQTGTLYPKGWPEWVGLASAKAVPGSHSFLRTADSAGVNIFYVTNRHESLRESTLKNLQSVGFPQARTDHLLMKTDTSSKEPRRQIIRSDYEIALLIGDNLNDFSEAFAGDQSADRLRAVDSLSTEFARRFILFPNPMYGAWEGAIYEGQWDRSSSDKLDMRHSRLKGYPDSKDEKEAHQSND
jgi:5'-nucleotidase (lipoprotein e(P4) family)